MSGAKLNKITTVKCINLLNAKPFRLSHNRYIREIEPGLSILLHDSSPTIQVRFCERF